MLTGPFSYQYIRASLSYHINSQSLGLEKILCGGTGELTARRHTTLAEEEPCSKPSQHALCQLCPQHSHWLLRDHPSNITILNFTCWDILHINPQHFLLHAPCCLGEKACAWQMLAPLLCSSWRHSGREKGRAVCQSALPGRQ